MDAFLAYLREDPRFTVTREDEFELDGHRAVEVEYTVGANITPPCWDFDGDPADKTGVLVYVPEAEPNTEAFWNAPIDSPGLLVVTEVDGATLTFESAIEESGTWADRPRGPRHGPLPRCPSGGPVLVATEDRIARRWRRVGTLFLHASAVGYRARPPWSRREPRGETWTSTDSWTERGEATGTPSPSSSARPVRAWTPRPASSSATRISPRTPSRTR